MSIKLSALYSQMDPIDPQGSVESVLARRTPLLVNARDRGVFVNLDMERYEVNELTYAVFEAILSKPEFRRWRDVGCVLWTAIASHNVRSIAAAFARARAAMGGHDTLVIGATPRALPRRVE